MNQVRTKKNLQIYPPMLARESAATITPSLKMKARVVVPFAGFTI